MLSPERRRSVIDAPKQQAIPRAVASPQSCAAFRPLRRPYTESHPVSTIQSQLIEHRNPCLKKSNTPVEFHRREKQNIEFENLFSNLLLTLFKTVADPFDFSNDISKGSGPILFGTDVAWGLR